MTTSKTVEQVKGEIQGDIDQLIARYAKYKEGGFSAWEKIRFTYEVAMALVEAVERIKGVPGLQKKEVVVAAVREVYRKVNPDLPLVPEPFETMLENAFLDKGLGVFIDVVVKKYNEKGIFKSKKSRGEVAAQPKT